MQRWRVALLLRRYAHTTSAATSRALPKSSRQPKPPQRWSEARFVPEPNRPQLAHPGQLSLKPNKVDPNALLRTELEQVRGNLLQLLGSSHSTLTDIAEYYFQHKSKQIRPLLILLFARATNGLGRHWKSKCAEAANEGRESLDAPLTRSDVLTDWNPNLPDHSSSFEKVFHLIQPTPKPTPSTPSTSSSPSIPEILPTQMRLAQIVEMIHVASLLHDDVIDKSSLRRGAPSAPAQFGNKVSVLGGDFLLGRASAALSRLGSNEVVELIASVIANLVEGEIIQMRETLQKPAEPSLQAGQLTQDRLNTYLRKTYLKTASLMAKGVRASVVLGGCVQGELWKDVAYAYGRNLGMAFQLVDDILDYEAGEATLGKPGGADLRVGLATGPALYAWEEHAEMGPLIERHFEREGDIELARDLVRRSSGVARTRALAIEHAEQARDVLSLLPESEARSALVALTNTVVKRTW